RCVDRTKVLVLHGRDLDTELDSARMPLSVDRFVIDNRYAANCWVVRAAEDAPAAVIDPGGDPEPLLEAGVDVAGILVTHGDVDLAGGDWETLLASVRALLERFGPDTTVYPGHGDPTTLGRELQSNPFLHELRAAAQ